MTQNLQSEKLSKDFQVDGLVEHSARSPDFNVMDIDYWVMAERFIWYKPQDEVPQNLEQLKQKLEEFSDLCCQEGSDQQKEIYNTFYGTPSASHNNQRRGGLIGRFFLAAQNNGEALDGINKHKERHAAELPADWRSFSGQLLHLYKSKKYF